MRTTTIIQVTQQSSQNVRQVGSPWGYTGYSLQGLPQRVVHRMGRVT